MAAVRTLELAGTVREDKVVTTLGDPAAVVMWLKSDRADRCAQPKKERENRRSGGLY